MRDGSGKTLLLTVSGHGYGHATRLAGLLRELRERLPALRCVVHAACPLRIFQPPAAPAGLVVERLTYDFGLRQQSSVAVDIPATLAGLAAGRAQLPEKQKQFRTVLRDLRPAAVVADIPAAPLAWAAASGIPAIGISNFTWDTIYAELGREFPAFLPYAAEQAEYYAAADVLLRLPFGPAPAAWREVLDIPLLGKRSTHDRAAARRALGLAAEDSVMLLSFGGFAPAGVTGFTQRFPQEWQFLSCTPWPGEFPGRLTLLGDNCPLPHEAVVAAADIVIGKPGYSTISECLANRTKFLYVPRTDNPECRYLADGVEQHGLARAIRPDDFAAGRWQAPLAELLADDRPWPNLRLDGAQVAADEIIRRAGLSTGKNC